MYLNIGLAVILIFIGAEFVLTKVVHVSVGVSLLVIVGVMGTAIAASLLGDRRTPPPGTGGEKRAVTQAGTARSRTPMRTGS